MSCDPDLLNHRSLAKPAGQEKKNGKIFKKTTPFAAPGKCRRPHTKVESATLWVVHSWHGRGFGWPRRGGGGEWVAWCHLEPGGDQQDALPSSRTLRGCDAASVSVGGVAGWV